jgi:hypothetical protein
MFRWRRTGQGAIRGLSLVTNLLPSSPCLTPRSAAPWATAADSDSNAANVATEGTGPFTAYYFDPAGGLHAQAGLLFAATFQ